jgi:ubiquinone/menaquinone biosynthesis C-methylase UbiE
VRATVVVVVLWLTGLSIAGCAGGSGSEGSGAVTGGPAETVLPPDTGDRRLFRAQDLGLLDAADREKWQKPNQIMDALKIAEGSAVAELGAAGGWFTMQLARRVEQNGVAYAEDIQPVMLEAIRRRAERENLSDIVRTIHGTATDPKLPAGALDAVLIVDAYGEMDDPADPLQIVTLLKHVGRSLKPQGCLGIVDFEPGGGGPGPAERIVPDTITKAAAAAGLQLLKREGVPPFQFLLVFGHPSSRCAS